MVAGRDMKTVAIMQPYLLPYLGYFHLMRAADTFIILDNVNFIKSGWINRNKILINGKECRFSFPVASVSRNKLINEHHFADLEITVKKFIKTLSQVYRKAPQYEMAIATIVNVLNCKQTNVALFLAHQFHVLKEYFGIPCEILLSSDLGIPENLRGQDRIIALCREVGAHRYVNAPGGKALYDRGEFARAGIDLRFLKLKLDQYPQFPGQAFVPFLSIIDVMMFNSRETVLEYLDRYEYEPDA